MKSNPSAYVWAVLIPLIILFALLQFTAGNQEAARVPYSVFQKELAQGHVQNVVVGKQSISGEFIEPRNGKKRFTTLIVPPEISAELAKAGVEYRGTLDTTWIGTLLSWVIPMGLFLGVWIFLMRRMGGSSGAGGFMQVGKSRAKVYVETDTKVGFDDVAGVDEAKEELVELIEFLKDPTRYGTLGAHIPKGVLLVGPPGTGKTLLARAVAGEAGVPFFSISGSEFVEMFVGVGAARVRDLFQEARSKAPAIIFIDELDALGRARGVFHQTGGNDEREQTLNQLLVELDGFDPSSGLVLLAATNRPEILDPALLRAGRFDRQVLVDRPDKAGRVQILKVHIKKIQLAEGVSLDQLAALTTGFTGADLANLVNEAALLATRRRAEAVSMDDFNNAIERIIAGLEKKNRILNAREREIVAHHEMGHALMTRLLPGVDPVHKVSIIPRGIGALGYTLQRPTEDRFLMTREELENKIAVLLGGRAAEKLIFDHLSTGAADDLAKATNLARSMVARYGMDEQLGYVTYDNEQPSFLSPNPTGMNERAFSEHTANAIDRAVRLIIHDVFERTYAALKRNRAVLVQSAHELLERETLESVDLDRLAQNLDNAAGSSVSPRIGLSTGA
ncbi:ATP-dependent zinc metalloprotease FtsH [Salinisphaera sp. SPP-AMP-43]|uniref:ATP-dependent zinc metalloprotease FtsH n=1 Tax=Salinisphaera sp. SPP-AMP-43 TaxID=3121288 RepID=UPI003C6DE866